MFHHSDWHLYFRENVWHLSSAWLFHSIDRTLDPRIVLQKTGFTLLMCEWWYVVDIPRFLHVFFHEWAYILKHSWHCHVYLPKQHNGNGIGLTSIKWTKSMKYYLTNTWLHLLMFQVKCHVKYLRCRYQLICSLHIAYSHEVIMLHHKYMWLK